MDFLEELTLLSRKHRKYISGCGCCGSPFICDFDFAVEQLARDDLNKDIEKNRYTVNSDLEYLTFEKEQTNG